jgi:uncharacterized protein (DUF1684 family)
MDTLPQVIREYDAGLVRSGQGLEKLFLEHLLHAIMKPEDVETWRRALLRFRERKDEFFRSDHDSPLGHGGQGLFAGLKYFEPDPAFRLEAKLQRYPDPESVIMTTSKGTRQLFNRVGFFDFTIDGQPVKLQAYQSAEREDASIFIPFRDATSGKESYGAARYLDLEVEHDDQYAVDFNYAYNPYCAYSEDYVCPLPPQENWLKVPIRAGEKKYHD